MHVAFNVNCEFSVDWEFLLMYYWFFPSFGIVFNFFPHLETFFDKLRFFQKEQKTNWYFFLFFFNEMNLLKIVFCSNHKRTRTLSKIGSLNRKRACVLSRFIEFNLKHSVYQCVFVVLLAHKSATIANSQDSIAVFFD